MILEGTQVRLVALRSIASHQLKALVGQVGTVRRVCEHEGRVKVTVEFAPGERYHLFEEEVEVVE